MAKKPKGVEVNVALLRNIANGSQTDPANAFYVLQADGLPLVNAGLIEVDTALVNAEGKAPARLSEAGKQYLNNVDSPQANKESASKPMFGIITANVEIPKSNRGNRKGAGAPTQYPFVDMTVGQTFFVPDSAKKGNAAKHLGSTVSQQNMFYRKETGATHEVTVTKRGKGNKAELNADGNKVKITKTVPVYEPTRKFVVRPVKKGVKYGEWEAPDDGAIVAREM